MKLKNKILNISVFLGLGAVLLIALLCAVMIYNYAADKKRADDFGEKEKAKTEKYIIDTLNMSDDEIVDAIIEKMSLSDMVYQMMFVTPEAITDVSVATRAGEATKKAIAENPVGGLVYFSANFENREQTKEMIAKTQQYSQLPLFIGVDEEGGRVSRLSGKENMGVTHYPPMREIGNSADEKEAYSVGETLGKELYELGFNVNFAPDADVLVNEENSEIGDRSFGTDASVVARMVKNVVQGLQDNNVSATIKHFPGHGSTFVDSHTGYSESNRTIEQLRETEFIPFKAGIEAGVDFVMVSHMTLTEATQKKLPSSVSDEVIEGMLIEELGYTGIIITDSFSMGAVTEEYSQEEASVMAVKAGADMILMPKELAQAHKAIVDAVESGEIEKSRIRHSVEKILKLKIKKGLIK